MYLHCWGGHGRTGTIVCIMLHMMYGLSSKEVLQRCQYVHDLRVVPIEVGSPQTPAQRAQVVRVIARLRQAKSLPADPHDPSPPAVSNDIVACAPYE